MPVELIIFLIISLMVVTFLAANNRKPKTIYLKPKDPGKEKKDKGDKEKSKKSKNEEPEDDEAVSEVPATPPPSRPDEDAMRSELKSLRQTAVSLTVGEKEGASALIKEWLEDNPNKVEENAEEAGEK